jgi:hypothetical protein
MPGRITAVAVSEDHAYLGTADGLVVADVTDPRAPRLVGEVPSGGGMPLGVAVSGNHAYIASGSSLSVIDVSRPSAPVVVARLYVTWYVSSVAVSGSHAFVRRRRISSPAGCTIDVSVPSHRWVDPPSPGTRLQRHARRPCVVAGTEGPG